MKLVKFLLLALGLYILWISVKAVGFEQIASKLGELKWKLLPLLLVYPFIFAFDTIGWALAFPKKLPKQVPFHELYLIRIIGETLNGVIPWAASLGGEPIKAQLLKSWHRVPLSQGYASILIVHTTFWLSLNIFVVSAILLTLKTMPLPPLLWRSVMIFLISLGLVAIFLVIGLHLGIFKKVHSLGESLKWWGESSGEKEKQYVELDEQIKKFYSHDRWRFIFSVFFNFLGWFTGTFETYWIARVLDLPISFTQAWLFEALIQVLRIITFFIPSSIGAQEGGIILIFSQFGISGPISLTFAVIRRVREILWIGLGLLIWSLVEDKPSLKEVKVRTPGGQPGA